jgi:hypothetical protein
LVIFERFQYGSGMFGSGMVKYGKVWIGFSRYGKVWGGFGKFGNVKVGFGKVLDLGKVSVWSGNIF